MALSHPDECFSNPGKHKTEPKLGFVELVPRRRLELPRPCGHQHLKLACLPISPSGQCADLIRFIVRLQQKFSEWHSKWLCHIRMNVFQTPESTKPSLSSVLLNWCPEEDSNFHDLAVTST